MPTLQVQLLIRHRCIPGDHGLRRQRAKQKSKGSNGTYGCLVFLRNISDHNFCKNLGIKYKACTIHTELNLNSSESQLKFIGSNGTSGYLYIPWVHFWHNFHKNENKMPHIASKILEINFVPFYILIRGRRISKKMYSWKAHGWVYLYMLYRQSWIFYRHYGVASTQTCSM